MIPKIEPMLVIALQLRYNNCQDKIYGLITMTTHFIAAEIDLQANPLKVKQEIEQKLASEGKPLRWAVTKVDEKNQKMEVEAIVTK